MSQESQTVVFTVTPVPGAERNADMWIGFVIGAVVLVAAAAWARRRAGQSELGPARRRTRILRAASAFGFGLALILAPREYLRGNLFAPWLSASDPLFILFGMAIGYTLAALVLIGTLDLLLDLFSPARSRLWLAIAPPLFLLYAAACAALTAWKDSAPLDPDPRQLLLVAAGLATGLVWWADLPAARVRVAQVFE